MRSQRLSETRRRVLTLLQELADRLNATVYLFGSYARGSHTLESDVDIVVVSREFEGEHPVERVARIRLMLPHDLDFDIIALTPRELEEKLRTSFYREISGYWIEIRPRKREHQTQASS